VAPAAATTNPPISQPAVTPAALSTSSPISQAAATSVPTPGSLAVSGAAVAAGMQANVDLHNSQISACATPDGACTAANGAGLVVHAGPAPSVEPAVPTIPPPPGGGGGTGGTGGGPGGSGTGGGGPGGSGGSADSGGSASHPSTGNGSSSRHSSATLAPTGSTVVVNPWVDFPGRRLPPLPKQPARLATGVVASQDLWAAWPGAEPPPMPGLVSVPSTQPAEAAGVQASPGAPAAADTDRGRTSSAPSAAAAEVEPDAQPPLTLVEMDPWMVWPEPGRLPVPRQAARVASSQAPAGVGVVEPVPAQLVLANPLPSGPAPSVVGEPTPLAPFALGGVALLALIGATTRPGRRWLVHQWRHWLEGAP
jgi:hypothetical protein